MIHAEFYAPWKLDWHWHGLHTILWAAMCLWRSGNDAIFRLYSVSKTFRAAVILSRGGCGVICERGGRFGGLIGVGLSLEK